MGAAVMVRKIGTGEIFDELKAKSGRACGIELSADERSQIANKAAAARWR
jgi:hypothetical protein